MATITASELKNRLAELLEVPRKEADNILWAFSEIATDVVKKGNSVMLPGIGKLECRVQPKRNARNPRTGESVKVPAKVVTKFKLAGSLKNAAPDLKSKAGKALLAEAEEKAEARDARKAAKEREEKRANRKGAKIMGKKKKVAAVAKKPGKKKAVSRR